MISIKKILIGAGIGGGLIYYFRLRHTNAELETVTTAMVHSLTLKGVSIRVDAILKNPTKTGLKIKFPFVKLYHQDKLIGSSDVIDKDITLPPFGQANVDQIMILIPLRGLFSVGASLIQSIQGGEAVKVKITTITTIDLGLNKVPYQKTQEVTLTK